ncbi:MAG TPA: PQQ-dependent sugar dehydrogenase [Caulobacteraceae bacterium]|jgi:glucose/arabinose dehydrogenase|nr:PQQ-dependent sugar dehydrogenase [Caulobacteraceae bacterium]
MNRRAKALLVLSLAGAAGTALAQAPVLEGAAAFGDWTGDAPGLWRKIAVADLPVPNATPSARNNSQVVPRPAGAMPKVPAGFQVAEFASGLEGPRLLRTAPNGDVLVAETAAGRIKLLRPGPHGAKAAQVSVFAEGLRGPFGLAFYPEADPQWLYVANLNTVVRFPYRAGDLTARGPAQTVVAQLSGTTGGHSTRDVAFSRDGQRLLVSVGSGSNVAEGAMTPKSSAEVAQWQAVHGLGASWGSETDRATVLSFTPEGGDRKVFATGIRNCVGLTRNAQTGDLYCSTNERDALGDNLVPDYVTRVKEGGFYGWPWYYLGSNQDPRHPGARPDLAGQVTVPDVLLQAHSAALQTTFYPADATGGSVFPAEYRGDAFVALHGSWNRATRTGYKLVRVRLQNGVPTGEYQDFLTGFVIDGEKVWGRPVGVTVAKDGALLVSEDGGGTIWRVSYAGPRFAAR